MAVVGAILLIVGIITSLVGTIWFLTVAFQESIFWGLGCLFIPFVALIFLFTHWDTAGRPFLLQLAALAPLIFGQIILSQYSGV